MEDEQFIRVATWPTERGTYLLVRKIPPHATSPPRFEIWGPQPASQVWMIDMQAANLAANANPQGHALLRRVGLLAQPDHVETVLDRQVLLSAVHEVLNSGLVHANNLGIGCTPWPFRSEHRIQEYLSDEKILLELQQKFRDHQKWLNGLTVDQLKTEIHDRLDTLCMVVFPSIMTQSKLLINGPGYQFAVTTRRNHELRMTLMGPDWRWRIEMVLVKEYGSSPREVLAEHEERLISTLLRLNLLAEDTPAGQTAYGERMIGDAPEPVWLNGLREALEAPRLLGTDPLTQTTNNDFVGWMYALGKLPEAWISIEAFEE